MTPEFFETVFEDTVQRSRTLLVEKGKEYSRDGDRLHNFIKSANLARTTPVEEVAGFMRKHTVSVYDMVQDYAKGTRAPLDKWDEKILDHINYLILLRAALIDDSLIAEAQQTLFTYTEFIGTIDYTQSSNANHLSEDGNR